MPDDLSLPEARRIALAAQGFGRARPGARVTAAHIAAVIRQLGLLQIDYVSVVAPAHYLTLYSRLGPYDTALLDRLLFQRREFAEQWAHEASIIPVEHWPLLRHRMDSHRPRPYGFEKFIAQQPDYVAGVLTEILTRGALTADQLGVPEGVSRRIAQDWFATVPRATLESHFGRGVLAIAGRGPNFVRSYDLAERVVPPEHYGRRVERHDAQRELLRIAARASGVAAAADLADYFRMPVREARPRIEELVEAGDLVPVRVAGWPAPAYLYAAAKRPRPVATAALLSPFDSLIWFRPRTARLFQFHYRFEIFTPPAKRKWGCYVLPFLLGESLPARVDLKTDRVERCLLVRAAYLEEGARADEVAPPLARELRTLAAWLGLDAVVVESRRGFARSLSDALRA